LNRNIETLCFGIEVKQLNQNKLFRKKPKQTKITGKILNFLKKYQNMLHIKLFNRIQFRLFRIDTSFEDSLLLLPSTAVVIITSVFTAAATHTSQAAPSPLVAVILVAACRRRHPPPLVTNRAVNAVETTGVFIVLS
jgi:hypothetical protein